MRIPKKERKLSESIRNLDNYLKGAKTKENVDKIIRLLPEFFTQK